MDRRQDLPFEEDHSIERTGQLGLEIEMFLGISVAMYVVWHISLVDCPLPVCFYTLGKGLTRGSLCSALGGFRPPG